MVAPFWNLRASLSRDKDARRLWWLLKHAHLQAPHHKILLRFRGHFDWGGDERAIIRTLFRLYRRKP